MEPEPSQQQVAELQQFMETENQKAVIQAAISKLTDICFEKWITKPGNKLDSSEANCVANCAGRFLDSSVFVVNRMMVAAHGSSRPRRTGRCRSLRAIPRFGLGSSLSCRPRARAVPPCSSARPGLGDWRGCSCPIPTRNSLCDPGEEATRTVKHRRGERQSAGTPWLYFRMVITG